MGNLDPRERPGTPVTEVHLDHLELAALELQEELVRMTTPKRLAWTAVRESQVLQDLRDQREIKERQVLLATTVFRVPPAIQE